MSATLARRLRPLTRPALLVATLTAGLALTLSGCSGSGGSTAGADPTSGTGTGQRAGGQRQPGVSGLIASVSGKTLQVQSTSEQTAVTWTGATTFTETKKASASALKTGLCATVRSADASASPGTTVAAASVTLSPAVDGACTGVLGGAGGGRPSGTPSGARPSGAPSGAAGSGTGGFGGRGTSGRVTSVDGSTFVVAATEPGGGTTTSDVTVTTAATTTWSEVAKASAADATVGRCATANGTTSGTGALTARTVRLSAPTAEGTCATFAGGRGGGQAGQGQPAGGSTTHG
ncbi:hypothetical protein GCM10022197_31550 [Microlunatus spumicola]|uniref:DUF5666 domain-containing protein n=1 Tax=Microlunatus spumicola TaxID=81499 RepID=A0ABP6XUQ0_9ACTN